ncbi:MAG: UDP-N-acetylmuramate dehydrogenase [bacterium]
MEFITKLKKVTERIKINEPMSAHTSIQIGGPADYFIEVENESQLKRLIRLCKNSKIPYFLVGGGSNLLVKDGGIRGVVLKLTDDFEHIVADKRKVIIGAGIALPHLLMEVSNLGLGGLEFLTGIPGTFGGAIFMNAGAYGASILERVNWLKIMDSSARVKTILKKDLRFSYRKSNLNGYIILEGELELQESKRLKVEGKMKGLLKLRENTQPLYTKSFGCMFKNPEKRNAGELIRKSGLADLRIGDAKISEKHPNFIENLGRAKARDVLMIIERVKEEVMQRFEVPLEEEVIITGS